MENNILGIRLRNLRESKDLKQVELSRILNISNTTLSQYEAGNRTPGDDIKKKIADYFNVSIDYLLGRSNSMGENDSKIETKAFHTIDIKGLSEDDIKQIDDYVKYIKQRQNSDGSLK